MQEIVLTPTSLVFLALIAVWAIWAVRRLVKRGPCDCGDHCGDCDRRARSGGPCRCEVVDVMVKKMEQLDHQ